VTSLQNADLSSFDFLYSGDSGPRYWPGRLLHKVPFSVDDMTWGERRVYETLKNGDFDIEYEQRWGIWSRGDCREWKPDFTIATKDERYYGDNHQYWIVEYAGMMDIDEDYAKGIQYKARAFARNQIQAVFVYPEDIRGKGWEVELESLLETAWARFDKFEQDPPERPPQTKSLRPRFSI
jgi:hypothetical protein